jgi:hypothetical protein
MQDQEGLDGLRVRNWHLPWRREMKGRTLVDWLGSSLWVCQGAGVDLTHNLVCVRANDTFWRRAAEDKELWPQPVGTLLLSRDGGR